MVWCEVCCLFMLAQPISDPVRTCVLMHYYRCRHQRVRSWESVYTPCDSPWHFSWTKLAFIKQIAAVTFESKFCHTKRLLVIFLFLKSCVLGRLKYIWQGKQRKFRINEVQNVHNFELPKEGTAPHQEFSSQHHLQLALNQLSYSTLHKQLWQVLRLCLYVL